VQSIRVRYLRERSILGHWRSVKHATIGRKKVLQIGALQAVRAMRSVFLRPGLSL
jgi:hypothetical protein